jgi:hypothetical protein
VALSSGSSPTTPHHGSLGVPLKAPLHKWAFSTTADAGCAGSTGFHRGPARRMEPEPLSIATTARGAGVVFSREERERHVWIVGKSGSGKSTVLFNLAMGDIVGGEGVAVIDPHGDLAEDILDAIPRSRINDVCYLDAGETNYPVGFNPATRIAPERRALAASGIVSAFKHLWSDSWGPRLEHLLYHGIAALISRRHATLIDLPRLYTDDRFRERVSAASRIPKRCDSGLMNFRATRRRCARMR